MKFYFAGFIAVIVTLAALLLIPSARAAQSPSSHPQPPISNSHSHLIVSPTGPYTTIPAALAAAHTADEIQVRGGTYRGALVVDKAVKLVGIGNPILDGGEQGTVVTLAADGAELHGFTIQGSGIEPEQDHAGVLVTAPRVVVEDNRIRDVLFGVIVFKAEDVIVRGNEISSKDAHDLGRKGDSIRLWYSPRVQLVSNHIHDSRDLVVWYSTEMLMRDNLIERGRYGVHLMYAQNSVIERNRIVDNSIGAFAMYSKNVVMRGNEIRGQRGPSGYAVGFKDADDLDVSDNVLVDNRGGIFVDGSPFSPSAYSRFHDNIIAFNDVGAIFLPASRGSFFENNTFWENIEQMAIDGGGVLAPNTWRGNFWSDYAGFDANRDGVGETSYNSERFFEGMMDREQKLRMLLFSPAVQAIEFAATSFPIVKPQPKLSDATPRVDPLPIPTFVSHAQTNSLPLALGSISLLSLGAIISAVSMRGVKKKSQLPNRNLQSLVSNHHLPITSHQESQSISVSNVTKRYAKSLALDNISFDARDGQAIALWGANGAGKTTLIKAILGLIDFDGEISVHSVSVKRNGKQARAFIGYVPQKAVFYDWSVRATMEYYARLKKTGQERVLPLLEKLGLSEHAHKSVSALSGGLEQRLALAIALLSDPPVLLFDEPTTSLDTRARSDYLSLIATLRDENRTIIFASHRLEEIESLADKVLVLEAGKMIGLMTPEELRVRLVPEVEMILSIAEAQRAPALAQLQQVGLAAHFNGRGTVVVRVPNQNKIDPLRLLSEQGIVVNNFEVATVLGHK